METITLSPMQIEMSEALLKTTKDVALLSPTGSGKTLACLLPLAKMTDTASDDVQTLWIAPGRELAMQTDQVVQGLHTAVRSTACYGGRPAMDEHRTIAALLPHIIIGTPGRVADHLAKRNFAASTVRHLVIDEFDKCMQLGFHDQLKEILSLLPPTVRLILLSATDTADIPSFIPTDNFSKIDYTAAAAVATAAKTEAFTVASPEKDKLATLGRLLCQLGEESTIVFLNYRDSVGRTAAYLLERGFSAAAYHGGMTEDERKRAIYRFANGSVRTLVSTDLGSRGLDFGGSSIAVRGAADGHTALVAEQLDSVAGATLAVSNIVHYQLPCGKEEYIHRTGRTARWDSTGKTYFILGPGESLPDYISCETSDLSVSDTPTLPPPPHTATLYIGKGKKDKISKADILGFLCKKAGLTQADIGRIDVYPRYAYVAVAYKKHKQAIALLQNEKIKGQKTVIELLSN